MNVQSPPMDHRSVGHTQRVLLRPVTSADEAAFLAMTQGSRDLHSPWVYPPVTRVGFRQYLARTEQADHEGLLVCRRTDGHITGVLNLNNIVRGAFLATAIGYYGDACTVGQGFMLEGLELLKDYAIRTLGLHRIEANIQPANQPSRRLAERAGFHLEGLSAAFLYINGSWRDHERWVYIDPRANLRP